MFAQNIKDLEREKEKTSHYNTYLFPINSELPEIPITIQK